MWRGIDPAQLKAVWAEKLGGFSDRPEIIKHALDSLDDKPWPPTLPEFVEICRNQARRIGSTLPAIEAPRLSKQELVNRAEQLSGVAIKAQSYDYKAWAKHLRSEYLAGVCLLPIQVSMASEALGETWNNRECRPRNAMVG